MRAPDSQSAVPDNSRHADGLIQYQERLTKSRARRGEKSLRLGPQME